MARITFQWKAHYGKDLLSAYGGKYESYIAITSPKAWEAVSAFHRRQLDDTTFAKMMEAIEG